MTETTVRKPIKWDSVQETHVGVVREMNEDSILSSQKAQLWAVADGMGGYESGNVASNMIVQTLEDLPGKNSLSEFIDNVEDSLIDVNQRILEYADIMLDGRTLGSTVVSLIIKERVGICLWAGDSRLYRLRNNQFVQLSRDHSQVEELVQQGVLSAEEADNHPDSNIITRAIGASQELYIDINVFSVQQGDIFLLCSDGLYNMISNDEIVQALSDHPISDAINILIDKVLSNGATDNVSVILVKGMSNTAKPDQNNKELGK